MRMAHSPGKYAHFELGCSKSSISLWMRDLPSPERPRPDTGAARQGAQRATEKRAIAHAELGAKAKPGSNRRVIFVNSDANMITLFPAWLDIHESADVPAAEASWANRVGIKVGGLLKTSLKKHNPKTNRTNVGEDYHGCLRVAVLQSADLHRRIEGWWYGIVGDATRRPD
ncbi:hypothetical protein AQJ64_31045 [Streptomyces griseoruber]|uniref:Uncharacterized protein n=2 Tax=Streptomyces griseoruber TaxID=1943 RepID=A0A101SR30_9ACTN|nr:hypothetical protein AQJ64_31045 [Streptomyces griseoruber]